MNRSRGIARMQVNESRVRQASVQSRRLLWLVGGVGALVAIALQLFVAGAAQGAGHEAFLKRGWERYQQAIEGSAAWEEALGAFNQALSKSPGEADALRGAGYVYYQLKWYDEAIDTLRKSLVKNPGLPAVKETVRFKGGVTATIESDAQSTLAWALRFKGRPAEAVQEFQKVVAREPKWVDPRSGLGWALYDQGRFAEAEREFAAALKVNAQYADARDGMVAVQAWRFAGYNTALAALGAGNYDGAISGFKAVLAAGDKRFPEAELWRVWNGLGWAHYYKGQHKDAVAAFQEALKQKKDNAEAWKGIGYASFYGLKHYDDAVAAFKQALGLQPQQGDVQGLLAAAHLAKKDWAVAIAEYQKVTAATPGLADPWIGLAKAHAGKGEDREAQAAYRKAIQIAPAYVMADPEFSKLVESRRGWEGLYAQVGDALAAAGKPTEAMTAYLKLLERVPEAPAALKGLARIAYFQGKWDETLTQLQRVAAQDPGDLEVQTLIGWAHYRTGNFDAALQTFRQIVQRDPKSVDAQDGLGWSLYRKGRYGEAEQHFKEALQQRPGHRSSVEGLALAVGTRK